MHNDSTIRGYDGYSSIIPEMLLKLRKTFGTTPVALDDTREATVPQGQSFAGLEITSEGVTVGGLLSGQSSENAEFSMGFSAAPVEPAILGEIFNLDWTNVARAPQVIAYWNFNSQTFSGNLPGQGTVPLSIDADLGVGTLSLAAWTARVRDTSGQLGNLLPGQVPGKGMQLWESSGNGSYLQFTTSMTGRKNLIVSFMMAANGSGDFDENQWSWSTDGVNFTNFGPVIGADGSFLSTVPAPSDLDGAATVYLRFTLNGAYDPDSTNRATYGLDNISLTATPDAVVTGPEQMVVRMSYDPSDLPGGYTPQLSVDTAEGFVNAVEGNDGGAPAFINGAYLAGTHGLGAFGHDAATHTVWAVINYSGSSFAVVLPTKLATLASLTLSEGGLVPALDRYSNNLNGSVPTATPSITLTPTLTAAGSSVTVNGNAVTSGAASAAVNLSIPETLIPIVVTAADGVTTRNYSLSVIRVNGAIAATALPADGVSYTGATLRGSVTSNGAPARVTFEYGPTPDLGSEVVATPEYVSGSSATAVSAVIGGLEQGETIYYRVKAAGAVSTVASTQESLAVPANDDCLLENLVVIGGSTPAALVPAFDPDVTSYEVAFTGQQSIFIQPFASDPTATIDVEGSLVVSGTTYFAAYLSEGTRSFLVSVTARDGSQKAYTVTARVPGTPVLNNPSGNATGITKSGANVQGTINPMGRTITALYYQVVQSASTPTTSLWVRPTKADTNATGRYAGYRLLPGPGQPADGRGEYHLPHSGGEYPGGRWKLPAALQLRRRPGCGLRASHPERHRTGRAPGFPGEDPHRR